LHRVPQEPFYVGGLQQDVFYFAESQEEAHCEITVMPQCCGQGEGDTCSNSDRRIFDHELKRGAEKRESSAVLEEELRDSFSCPPPYRIDSGCEDVSAIVGIAAGSLCSPSLTVGVRIVGRVPGDDVERLLWKLL